MINNNKSIICCSPFFGENWDWLASKVCCQNLEWYFFNNHPSNLLEKFVKRPDLAMIRASRQAVQAAINNRVDLIITHDPRVSFWYAFFARYYGVRVKHIAWSFNFPELPRGLKRQLMTEAFKSISQFIVYSNMEKTLYSNYFSIPEERFLINLWGVKTPEFYPETPIEKGEYICAIGGNARDYKTLIKAMEKLPQIPLVLVARPNNLRGLSIPDNVKVQVNIPKSKAMNILNYSRFMVLPLKGSEVPCGHVTLVAAMHLGKAFIITNSLGVEDYVSNEINAVTCQPFNPDALAIKIKQLWQSPEKCQILGENGREFALKNCSEDSTRESLQNLLIKMELC